jgi:hypothetical protein
MWLVRVATIKELKAKTGPGTLAVLADSVTFGARFSASKRILKTH